MENSTVPIASCNVYVASLPAHYSEENLRKLMSPFGNIVSVRVMKDARTGRCKGYGFVLFESEREAACAINSLIAHVVDGSRIQVRFAHAAATPRPVALLNSSANGSPMNVPINAAATTTATMPMAAQPVYVLSSPPPPQQQGYAMPAHVMYASPHMDQQQQQHPLPFAAPPPTSQFMYAALPPPPPPAAMHAIDPSRLVYYYVPTAHPNAPTQS